MKKPLLVLIATMVLAPQLALAAWWNPFTWSIFRKQTEKSIPVNFVIDSTVSTSTANIGMTQQKTKNATTTPFIKKPPSSKEKPVSEIKIVPLRIGQQDDTTQRFSEAPLSVEKIVSEIKDRTYEPMFFTEGEGFYSVVLESEPVVEEKRSGGILSVKIKLKNLNVKPFITNFGGHNCSIVDSKGNKYEAELRGSGGLEKALLPNKEISIEGGGELFVHLFGKGEVDCSKWDTINRLWNNKCFLNNETGICGCENLGTMKVVSCLYSISSDGKSVSGGWGKYFQTVNMQN